LANIQSAIKRNRQNIKRRARNRMRRSRMRTFEKKADALLAEGNQVEAAEAVLAAIREIDKAAQKGIIHRNNAARRKSRLVKRLDVIS
jgi:small subunit ribosomal protein S20